MPISHDSSVCFFFVVDGLERSIEFSLEIFPCSKICSLCGVSGDEVLLPILCSSGEKGKGVSDLFIIAGDGI